MKSEELFTLDPDLWFSRYFDGREPPWKWLPMIREALSEFPFSEWLARPAEMPDGAIIKGDVWIDHSVAILGPCYLQGPAWIGPDVEIRPNAFIRGNVIVGKGSVLGNSCEYKNALLIEKVETAHFNYVGDSILGRKAHLGAGVICANLKLARDEVSVRLSDRRVRTGLRKVGAFVGDEAEVTCNAVLQPGSILGRRSAVLRREFHGYLPPDTLALADKIVSRKIV